MGVSDPVCHADEVASVAGMFKPTNHGAAPDEYHQIEPFSLVQGDACPLGI
jgi:hypothetical protein